MYSVLDDKTELCVCT